VLAAPFTGVSGVDTENPTAKRLKELEGENARLKKLVANQAVDIDMPREPSRY